jgi:redox-sensitive bicupin YhaK (pirin superfamily)
VHFLQVWVIPDTRGLAPRYDQRPFDSQAARRGFVPLATRAGGQGAIQVQQDVDLLVTRLGPGERREHPLRPGRHAWLHVARGSVRTAGYGLAEGDGLAASDESALVIEGVADAELLLFDLA